MSFVTALRDYVDILNASTDSLSGNLTIQEFLIQTFFYIVKSFWLAFIYIFTGQWLRDLAFLPIKTPQISLSVIKESYVPALSPLFNNLNFPEAFQAQYNLFLFFIIGFLNSFFASLPLSSAHLLSGRRLFVQGIPAGLASGFGTLTGHLFFLTCVLFGLRPLIIPWTSFQPFSAFFSFSILLALVFAIAHQRSFQIIKSSDFKTLGRFFLINFLLSWCEQSAFFHHLGNVTVSPSGSILESFSLPPGLSEFVAHLNYLIGFLVGGSFFTVVFILSAVFCRDLVLKWTSITVSRLIQQINFWSMSSLIALSLCTFPFYGVDILFGKPFGILPEERFLHGTVISPNKMSDLEWFLYQNKPVLTKQSDLTPWDTGFYLQGESKPIADIKDAKEKEIKLESEDPLFQFQSFEDLNLGGDYAWTTSYKRRTTPQRESARSFGKWLREIISQGQATEDRNDQNDQQIPSYQKKFFSFSSSSSSPSPLAKGASQSQAPSLEGTGSAMAPKTQQMGVPFLSKNLNPPNDEESQETDVSKMPDIYQYFENEENKTNVWRSFIRADDLELDSFDDGGEQKKFLSDSSAIKERENEDLDIDFLVLENRTLGLSPFFRHNAADTFPFQEIVSKRFYETIAYKKALDFDIDLFISRQPKYYLISDKEEIELLEKRQSLGKYYETLRSYEYMKDIDLFNEYFGGSKSYANKFYNQQFKGTLKVVRKLFSIHLSDESESSPLQFDQPLFLEKNKKIPVFHEELFQKNKSVKLKDNSIFKVKKPFLKGFGSKPLYAGWDGQAKKLILTNRFLPRFLTGQKMAISKDQQYQYPTLKKIFPLKNSIVFTSWPMPREIFVEKTDVEQFAKKYNLMYQIKPKEEKPPVDFEDDEANWEMATTPTNFGPQSLVDQTQYVWKVFPPDRSGMLWPGSNKLKFDFKRIFFLNFNE